MIDLGRAPCDEAVVGAAADTPGGDERAPLGSGRCS
jgi:hypothetical protein